MAGEKETYEVQSNINRQELTSEYDSDGKLNIRLQTTVDFTAALEQVARDNEAGGRVGSGSDEMVISCEIPDELWALDPLLKKASFFAHMGDRANYTHYLRQFMKLHPKLCPTFRRKYY